MVDAVRRVSSPGYVVALVTLVCSTVVMAPNLAQACGKDVPFRNSAFGGPVLEPITPEEARLYEQRKRKNPPSPVHVAKHTFRYSFMFFNKGLMTTAMARLFKKEPWAAYAVDRDEALENIDVTNGILIYGLTIIALGAVYSEGVVSLDAEHTTLSTPEPERAYAWGRHLLEALDDLEGLSSGSRVWVDNALAQVYLLSESDELQRRGALMSREALEIHNPHITKVHLALIAHHPSFSEDIQRVAREMCMKHRTPDPICDALPTNRMPENPCPSATR